MRVNVSKSKIIRCSGYGNGGRMNMKLNWRAVRGSRLFQVPGIASGS